MYLRLYVEASLKYPSSDYHTLLVIPEEGREPKVVNAMLKKENDLGGEADVWYGTKEELKESEDFFPFVLVKLSVPQSLKEH